MKSEMFFKKEPLMYGNHSNEMNYFDRNFPKKGMSNLVLKEPRM